MRDANQPEDQKPDEQQEQLRRLAEMSPIEYDRVREERAKELGIRVGTLDKEVARMREAEAEDVAMQDIVEEINPHPEPVPGIELLHDLEEVYRGFVIADESDYVALALWTLGTYCFDLFNVFPKLAVMSPEKRCGKTTLLEAMDGLVYRSLMAANITPSAVFRTIEAWRPSLLIDEADTFMGDNEELRGVVNAGHRKNSAFVIRTEKVNDQFVPRKFSVWAPMAIAGIGKRAATIMDRSIVIYLRRKRPDEKVIRLRSDFRDAALSLRKRCLRWAQDNKISLGACEPEIPECGNDRAVDNWFVLFAIAEVVGGDWLKRTQEAYQEKARVDEDEAAGPMLLADIKQVFESRDIEQIHSETLVSVLTGMEDRPWCEWKRGKPMTQNSLARMLKDYKIRPKQIRIGDLNRHGYRLKQFTDAFERYIPTEPPDSKCYTATNPVNTSPAGEFKPLHEEKNVEVVNRRKAINNAGCSGVAVEKPPSDGKGLYHGFSMADLEAEADPSEWAEIKDNTQALETFARVLSAARLEARR